MRLVEALQIVGGVTGAVATAFMALEQLVVRRFRRNGANSPETAIEVSGLRPLSSWRLGRLAGAGAVVKTQDGRWFLDEAVYLVLRRRRAVVGVLLVMVVLALVVVAYTLLV